MATAVFQSILPSIIPFPVPHPLQDALRRLLGIAEIERIYTQLRAMGGDRPITERLLDYLGATPSIAAADLAHVPRNGAAILTVNHPFGVLEGAVIAELLRRVRPDVRFLANGILAAIPEVREMVVPVDPMSGRKSVNTNGAGLRRALEHLEHGGMLVVFPAGEVSHFHWRDRAVMDSRWHPAVARLVRSASRRGSSVSIVPAYIGGANSALFQIAGMAHPRFRTALLGRELLNKRGRRIDVRIGTPIASDKLLNIPTAREQTDYLRWRTYLLSAQQQCRRLGYSHSSEIASPGAPEVLADEVAALPPDAFLGRSGDLEVYITPAGPVPHVLRELARLREITFRAAGEGTGNPLDLDEFDASYLHLFVWNSRRRELVGVYRLAATDRVRRLYTATLFRYGKAFLDRLGPALELGRSFVRQEYQKGFAPLLLLWKGIGAYIARNPRYRTLFGPVSISNQYEAMSRELMVAFLEKYALLKDWAGLVRNRQAFRTDRLLRGAQRPAFPAAGFDVEDLSTVVADIEKKQTGVPVLLRQYLRLGGKLLGFNVDPKFANALDGLILVDLTQTEPKLLERYLGKREAATFLEYQKGNYAHENIQLRKLGAAIDCRCHPAANPLL